jgi:hypothetical protein
MSRTWLLAASIVLGCASTSVKADDLLPVPDAAAQAKAEKLIKDLFRHDYLTAKRASRLALAQKLWDQAAETKDDPVARFVLLREAQDVAAKAGDVVGAFKAVAELAKFYAVHPAEIKAGVLELAKRSIHVPLSAADAVRLALAVALEAADEDDFPTAARLLKVAEAAAPVTKNVALVTAVRARAKEIEELRADFERMQPDLAALQKKPDDPALSFRVGKYLCAHKGKWPRGLALLAKGDNGLWKDLAEKDLAEPQETDGQIEVGESWLELSKAEKGMVRKHLQWRARHWFEKALPKVTGPTQEKLEAYLKDIPLRDGATGLAKVYLSDLQELDAKLGFGQFGKKGKLGYGRPGAEIVVIGQASPNGLSTHPPNFGDAVVRYKVGRTAQEFRASVALNDTARATASPLTFVVVGDGKTLWASRPVQTTRVVQNCAVAVTGVDVLELRVHCPGSYGEAHAVWLEPYVLTTGPAKVPASTPPPDEGGQQFIGTWTGTVAGTGAVRELMTIGVNKGQWSVKIVYFRGNKAVGLAESTEANYAAGKLTYSLHHIRKVAPNWQDSSNVASVQGDRLECQWKAGAASGTSTLLRVQK